MFTSLQMILAADAQLRHYQAQSSIAVAQQTEQSNIALRKYLDRANRVMKRPDKCPCCGSRQFKEHRGQTVCIYCRSTQ